MAGKAGRTRGRGGAVAEKLSEYLAGSVRSQRDTPGERPGVLPDTCAWIEYFRATDGVLSRALDCVLRREQAHTCGQVMFELLQGVRSEPDRSVVIGALGSLEYLEMTPRVWIRAAGLSADLRRRGRQLPYSDVVIAALALEHGLAVLTVDRHFREIPGLALRDMEHE